MDWGDVVGYTELVELVEQEVVDGDKNTRGEQLNENKIDNQNTKYVSNESKILLKNRLYI